MLAVHPSTTNNNGGGGGFFNDVLSSRGRSRQVSRTALARQASEERTTSSVVAVPFPPILTERTYTPKYKTSPTPSSSKVTLDKVNPMSTLVPLKPPYAAPFTCLSPLSSASVSPVQQDSPVSPSLSLEDQVHEAYALEDIHLAKILLLRLKGIEVTSDDDPRIAAVQDEDFDFCFLPNGPLLTEQDELALKEIQARELERIAKSRRVERMRICERKWIEEKQKMRDQRVAAFRRGERRRQEEERRRASNGSEVQQQRPTQRTKSRPDRKIVNYDHLTSQSASSNHDTQFVYDFMIPDASSLPPRPTHTLPPAAPVQTRHLFPIDDSRTIPFKDVLKSMEGQLFPFTDEERKKRNVSPPMANSRSRPSSRRRDLQLLEILLAKVEYTDERRKRKGKGMERDGKSLRSPVCLACSAHRRPLPSPSSTMSSISRTSSWLSFRTSSSFSSSATELTTPSSSPMMPSRKSSWLASRPQSWIPGSTLSEMPHLPLKPFLRHSCRTYRRLTPITLSEAPLVMDASPRSTKSSPLSYEGNQRSSSRVRTAKDSAGVLVTRVSKIVELAKGLQTAYVTATLFRVTVSYEVGEERHAIFNVRNGCANLDTLGQSLGPPGSRASAKNVKAFLNVSTSPSREEDGSENLPPPKYIPLTSPYPPTEPPRTVLPEPLPYQLHFKPIPQPIRSPFRHHAQSEMHTMHPSVTSSQCHSDLAYQLPVDQLSWRIRCVGNPAYLRLKALQNIVWSRGVEWEGSRRDTAIGGGKERVIGVAYEGIRRSNLSYSTTG